MSGQANIATSQRSTMPITQCIFRKGDSILVAKAFDREKGEIFYKPPGGKIEFGEYSWANIRRQIKQGIGEEIKNLSFVGPLESIFQYEGNACHEIVFIFEGEFVNKSMYAKDEIITQGDNGTNFSAEWKPLKDFYRNKAMLYPDGLIDMLKRQP